MAALTENSGVEAPNGAFSGVMISRGASQAPFSMFLGDSSNWKTPARSFLSSSLGKVVSSKGIDFKAQEDARQITWQGGGRGLVSLQTQRQADLTSVGDASELSLSMHYRLDKKPTSSVFWGGGCGDNCGAKLDITKALSEGNLGEWRKLNIPLRCFSEAGLNLKAVNAPLLLETDGSMALSLTGVELIKATASCPNDTL